VGGGYNLRVILRRALSILERLRWNIKLEDIADMHIDYLKQMYPELEEHREDVRTILHIESGRYVGSKERMNAIATSIKSAKKKLAVNDLIRMYESDGITPDFLMEVGAIESIPSSFYTNLAELHISQTSSQNQKTINLSLDDILPTRLLYYQDVSIREFTSEVIRVVDNKYVILDQTAFYPRGGGQEPDSGEINGINVIDVIKQADVVVHKMQNAANFVEGEIVHSRVNNRRRNLITTHHTSTHILNTSARMNLGSWVWQNSAFKDEKYARLDITHHSALNREEVEKIEKTANNVIRQNLPILIKTYDRSDAEQKYTFRIYQGGAAPTNNIRIVNIDGWDIEACGGTHVRRTGELGLIKIMKAERIQDGVVRLEFVAGEAAIDYIQKQENQLNAIALSLHSSKDNVVESSQRSIDDAEAARRKTKALLRKAAPYIAESVSVNAKQLPLDGIKFYTVWDNELDDEYHIAIGEKSIEDDPSLIYIALISKAHGMRMIVFVGKRARKKIKAGIIAKMVCSQLGGSGGGDEKFGQGGGRLENDDNIKEKIRKALLSTEELIIKGTGE
jgi:alanyl-tRNA synthetase